MATTTKNPTELLWAYALKREHKHLLTRIQQIESANTSQESRIITAEQAALSARGTDVAALTKQVQSIQNDTEKHARKLEDKIANALDTNEVASEAMCLKLEAMEKEGGATKEEERKKGFAREKALLKRVGELETGCSALKGELEGLKEKAEDDGNARLRAVVNGLEVAVELLGGELDGGLKKLKDVEAKYLELEKMFEKYKCEAAELAAQAATRSAHTSINAVQAYAPAQTHRQNQMASARPMSRPTDMPAMPAKQPRTSAATAATKMRKPHHKTTMQKEVEALLSSNAATSSTQKRPAVRQGKGWLEIERTPSTDMPIAPAQPVRQARGGATQTQSVAKKVSSAPKGKKRKIEPGHESESQPVQTQRTTRSQMPMKPIKATKPSPGVPTAPAQTQRQRKAPAPKANTKKAAAPTKKPVKTSARLPPWQPSPVVPESPAPNSVVLSQLSTVLSSVSSSPSPSHRPRKKQRKAESEVQVPASPPEPSPRPRRRHIQQKDDYETFLRRCQEANSKQ